VTALVMMPVPAPVFWNVPELEIPAGLVTEKLPRPTSSKVPADALVSEVMVIG
jgi:hypothetical protein